MKDKGIETVLDVLRERNKKLSFHGLEVDEELLKDNEVKEDKIDEEIKKDEDVDMTCTYTEDKFERSMDSEERKESQASSKINQTKEQSQLKEKDIEMIADEKVEKILNIMSKVLYQEALHDYLEATQ